MSGGEREAVRSHALCWTGTSLLAPSRLTPPTKGRSEEGR
jgi:hypothetical protein